MAVNVKRGNIPARDLPATTASVIITLSVPDLVSAVTAGTMPREEAERAFLRRAQQVLNDAVEVSFRTDTQIDVEAAQRTTEAIRLKSLRPTGGLQ